MYPDADSGRLYFEEMRWGPGNRDIACPCCGGTQKIGARTGKRTGYYRCGDCKEEFTVRTGTVFGRSHVPLNKWLYADDPPSAPAMLGGCSSRYFGGKEGNKHPHAAPSSRPRVARARHPSPSIPRCQIAISRRPNSARPMSATL